MRQSPAIHVRPATESDAEGVVALWNRERLSSPDRARSGAYDASHYAGALDAGQLLIAVEARKVIGALSILEQTAWPLATVASDNELELSHLIVAAEHRRRGVGALLMNCAYDEARRRGRRAIVLATRAGQDQAHGLFRALGYRRVPERDQSEPFASSRLVYRLDLTAVDPLGRLPYA